MPDVDTLLVRIPNKILVEFRDSVRTKEHIKENAVFLDNQWVNPVMSKNFLASREGLKQYLPVDVDQIQA